MFISIYDEQGKAAAGKHINEAAQGSRWRECLMISTASTIQKSGTSF